MLFEKINSLIEKLVVEKEALEAIIRKKEPHLQSKDDLFADFPTCILPQGGVISPS